MPVRSVRTLVLVVDDEPMIREILAEWLVEEGYRVQCAADGQEALDLVGAEIPDVIVTDIRMPRVHGIQLIERLRDAGHATPGVRARRRWVDLGRGRERAEAATHGVVADGPRQRWDQIGGKVLDAPHAAGQVSTILRDEGAEDHAWQEGERVEAGENYSPRPAFVKPF